MIWTLGQFMKAYLRTLHALGMEMLVRLEQSRKASFPISVTDGGMAMLVRLEQPRKALSPIHVTDSEMEILARLEQP